MTPEQLDAIQARVAAATEGPWANYGDLAHEVYPVRTGEDDEPENIASVVQRLADAHFISNARTDVPALLAYARDLEARIERGLAACDRVLNNEDGHKPPGPPHPTQQQATAVRIRAALTATEGA